MVQMHSNDRNEINEVRAGDIAAAMGLHDVTTGDTLCARDHDHHARTHGVSGAGDLGGGRAEVGAGPREHGRRARASWRRKIRRFACTPTQKPDKRSSKAWASCTSRSSSIGCGASSKSMRTSANRASRIAKPFARTRRNRRQVRASIGWSRSVRRMSGCALEPLTDRRGATRDTQFVDAEHWRIRFRAGRTFRRVAERRLRHQMRQTASWQAIR